MRVELVFFIFTNLILYIKNSILIFLFLKKMAKSIGAPFIETSAKDTTNVTEAFNMIAQNIKTKFIDNA